MRLVLFDCDGTLADSFALICETMRRTFAAEGLPEPDDRATRGVIGLSLDQAIHQLTPTFATAEIARLADTYRMVFHQIRAEQRFTEALFPGILPLLRALNGRDDLRLGMVTGKSRRGVGHVIETHGLEGVFQVVRTADDCPSKPHPAMVLEACAETAISAADTVVIGDAIFDMQMAAAAGARGLGVAWGAETAERLRAAGAWHVASDVADLGVHLEAWAARGPAEIVKKSSTLPPRRSSKIPV